MPCSTELDVNTFAIMFLLVMAPLSLGGAISIIKEFIDVCKYQLKSNWQKYLEKEKEIRK